MNKQEITFWWNSLEKKLQILLLEDKAIQERGFAAILENSSLWLEDDLDSSHPLESLEKLSQIQNISHLELAHLNIKKGLKGLEKMCFKELYLFDLIQFDDTQLNHISGLKTLEKLTFDYLEDIRSIPHLPNLKQLLIIDCPFITDFSSLEHSKLEELHIVSTMNNMGVENWDFLSSLKNTIKLVMFSESKVDKVLFENLQQRFPYIVFSLDPYS